MVSSTSPSGLGGRGRPRRRCPPRCRGRRDRGVLKVVLVVVVLVALVVLFVLVVLVFVSSWLSCRSGSVIVWGCMLA